MNIKIQNLLSQGERVTLECKKAQRSVPNSLWDTYSAFANTYGGTILLGVYENMTENDPAKRFEIPVVAKKMAKSGKYDAVICLGAVIRGATSHYDYVCNEVSKGVASVSLETEIPVLFGVVTTENIEHIQLAVP